MDMLLGGGAGSGAVRSVQNVTPANGATVVVTDSPMNIILWLAPVANIAAATIQLPTDAGSFIGQELEIGSSKAVTTLTVTGATTIYNPASTLQVGDLFILVKVASNIWARQQ